MRKIFYFFVIIISPIIFFNACSTAPSETGSTGSTAGNPAAGINKTVNKMSSLKQETRPHRDFKTNPLYLDFAAVAEPGFIIPGLGQNAVPQGIAYIKSANLIIISNYTSDGRPSCITAVDMKTGKLVKTVWLLNKDRSIFTGHAGGICVSRKHIWVASGKGLYRISIADFEDTPDNGFIAFKDYYETETRGSFATYARDVVWVGEFAYYPSSGRRYETKRSHHLKDRVDNLRYGWAAGYKLDPVTDNFAEPVSENGNPQPDYILSIMDKVQGMTFTGNIIALSTSYGRANNSTLLIHSNPMNRKPDKYVKLSGERLVPLWFIDSGNSLSKLVSPSMMEGITKYGNSLVLLFESGANKYQSGGVWPLDKTYLINISKLLSGDNEKTITVDILI